MSIGFDCNCQLFLWTLPLDAHTHEHREECPRCLAPEGSELVDTKVRREEANEACTRSSFRDFPVAAKKMPPQRVANDRNKKADPGSPGERASVMREGGGCARLRHKSSGSILDHFWPSASLACVASATSGQTTTRVC